MRFKIVIGLIFAATIIFAVQHLISRSVVPHFFDLHTERANQIPLSIVRVPVSEVSVEVQTTSTPTSVKEFSPGTPAAWINGSYFNDDYTPSGMVTARGERVGIRAFDPTKSAFLIASSSAAIVPGGADVTGESTLIQSYPLLIENGLSRLSNDSGLRARRSAVALDGAGNILLIASAEKEITLHEFADALTHIEPHIVSALNLDGGSSTGVATYDDELHGIDSFARVPYVLMLKKKLLPRQLVGVLVNHHLLARQFIDEEIKKIATNDERTIVLISPNHYGLGGALAQTTAKQWHVGPTTITTDASVVKKLEDAHALATEESTFVNEHGIYNIIPYIAEYVPHAHVIPIVIKDSMTTEEARALARTLHENLPPDTIWIGSFDFSHYVSGPVAAFHDVMSIDTIRSGDVVRAGKLDTDSKPGLQVLLSILQQRGAQQFELTHNTNSDSLIRKPWSNDNTSYVTGSFYKGLPDVSVVQTELQIPVTKEGDLKKKFVSMQRVLEGQDTTTLVRQDLPVGLVRAIGKIMTTTSTQEIAIPLEWNGTSYTWPDEKAFDILTTTK